MATKYVSSSATGSGTGTLASPWTLDQAASGALLGDTVIIKADGTYIRTTEWQLSVAGVNYVGGNSVGNVDGTRAAIRNSANSINVLRFLNGIGYVTLQNLDIASSAASPGDGVICSQTGNINVGIQISNSKISNCRKGISGDYTTTYTFFNMTLDRVEITGCNTNAIHNDGAGLRLMHCYLHDNTGDTVYCGSHGNTLDGDVWVILEDTTIARNSGSGVRKNDTQRIRQIVVRNSRFDTNGVNGIYDGGSSGSIPGLLVVENSIFWNHHNTGCAGIYYSNAPRWSLLRNNAYGGNTADRNNVPAGANEIVGLITTPWNNPSTGDYSLIVTSTLRGAGFPAYLDIGGSQHSDSSQAERVVGF
jgi:hypothetical protein